MATIPVLDSGMTIPVGRIADFQPRLMVDGVAIDLTGKTVTATFRRASSALAAVSLGASWENQACSLGNPTWAANQGGVRIQKELLAAAFAVPADPVRAYEYLAEFYVVEDDYSPQKLLFRVTASLRS